MTKDKQRQAEVERGCWKRPGGSRGHWYGSRELQAAERLIERGVAREVSRRNFYEQDRHGVRLTIELARA
jgi:hypothetical protein